MLPFAERLPKDGQELAILSERAMETALTFENELTCPY